MNYLSNIVGLTGTTTPPAIGAKLVNDLPIISSSFVVGSGKLTETGIDEIWERTLTNGADIFEMDLYSEISKEDRFRQLMSMTADFQSSTNPDKAASERYEGVRLRAARQKNTVYYARSLYVSGAGSYNWKIFDLTTGLELYASTEPTVITTEGYITINKRLSLDKLRNVYQIAIDATDITLGAINGNQGFINDRCGSFPVEVTSGYIEIVNPKTDANFVASNCYVHLEGDIASDLTNFVSTNTDLFGLAAQYLCGSLLLNDSLKSDKFNIWTNTNRIERQDEAIRQEMKYKEYLCKSIQPALMRLAPTVIVEKKDASEKLGIHTQSLIPDYPFEHYGNRYGILSSQDYPVY